MSLAALDGLRDTIDDNTHMTVAAAEAEAGEQERVQEAGATSDDDGADDDERQVDSNFIDNIIAELNGTTTHRVDDYEEEDAGKKGGGGGNAHVHDPPAPPSSPASADPLASTGSALAGDENNSADALSQHDHHRPLPNFSDGAFWGFVLRGLQDPLLVGLIVALISSPRIQRRITAFVPVFIGDSVQSTLIRVFVAIVAYIVLRRLLHVF